MKNFAEFKEAMKSEVMCQELATFIIAQNPRSKDAIIPIISNFATAKGFEVTKEELQLDFEAEKELSPAELEKVSGGNIFDTMWNSWKKAVTTVYDILKETDISELAKEFWDKTFG